MTLLNFFEFVGFIITLVLLWLIFRELKKSIKDSNNGKKNDKCDLD